MYGQYINETIAFKIKLENILNDFFQLHYLILN